MSCTSNGSGCVFTSIRGWFHSFRFWLCEASPLLCRLAAATACAWAFFAIGRCLRAVQSRGKKSDVRPQQPVLPVKPNPVVDPISEPWSKKPEGVAGRRAGEEEDQEASRRSSYDSAIQQGSELEPNEKGISGEQHEAEYEQSKQPPYNPDAESLFPTSTVPATSTIPPESTATATAGSAIRRRQFRVKQQSYMEAISHGMIATPAPEPPIPEEDTPTTPQATPTRADHPSGPEEPKAGQDGVSRQNRTSPRKQESYMEAIKQGIGRQDRIEDNIPPPKLPPLDPVKEAGNLETEI